MNCGNLAKKAVCVEAKITDRPKAEAGSVQVFCCGEPKLVDCSCMPSEGTFDISQMICVKIHVTLSARAMAEATGTGCMQCEERCYPDPRDEIFEDDE